MQPCAKSCDVSVESHGYLSRKKNSAFTIWKELVITLCMVTGDGFIHMLQQRALLLKDVSCGKRDYNKVVPHPAGDMTLTLIRRVTGTLSFLQSRFE